MPRALGTLKTLRMDFTKESIPMESLRVVHGAIFPDLTEFAK
jgi:hypothetical protein